ncbi:MAG: hypothetical protein WD472_11400 [Dehalococcoidia bacterium]
MKVWTSSWFTDLPVTIQKIGISRGTPRGYPAGYRKMPELAPGAWFKTASPAEYHDLFMDHLARLDVQVVIDKIARLSAGRDAVLLCYESPDKPRDWCHRGQVSAWLFEKGGLEVFEWGHLEDGCGWQHPKLLPQFQKGRLL